jgi:hypothetical protein
LCEREACTADYLGEVDAPTVGCERREQVRLDLWGGNLPRESELDRADDSRNGRCDHPLRDDTRQQDGGNDARRRQGSRPRTQQRSRTHARTIRYRSCAEGVVPGLHGVGAGGGCRRDIIVLRMAEADRRHQPLAALRDCLD